MLKYSNINGKIIIQSKKQWFFLSINSPGILWHLALGRFDMMWMRRAKKK